MTQRIRDVFFTLLSCELRNQTAEGIGEFSEEEFEQLYRLSKSHDLAHLIAEALSKIGIKPEGKIGAAFQKQWMLSAYRYEQIHYELGRLVEAFEKARIPHIPLKGSVIRSYYPEPWMRTSCDIDVYVREEDLERAEKVLLEELSYRWDAKGTHDVAFYTEENVHIELHFDLIEFHRMPAVGAVLAEAWEHSSACEGWSYKRELSDAMFYFYHIAHMAKHFLTGGCGIRPFMDLWILRHKMEFDDEKRYALLKRGELATFARKTESLAEVWFSGAPHEPFLREMEHYLLFAGTYGSTENRVAVKEKPKGGKFGYVLSRIFVPYRDLKVHYPVLEKHKWLFPFYQVVRWCRLIFKGRNRQSVRTFKAVMSTTDEKRERLLSLYKKLGL